MVVMEMLKCICILSVTFLHCIVAILRSEEVFLGQKVPEAIFVHGCHGNGIHTKFHFHALHGVQV